MNIAVDIRPLMEGKLSGIEVYILNLLREILKIDHENTYILFANAAKNVSAYLPKIRQENVVTIQTKIPNKLFNMSLCLFSYPKIDRVIQ